MNGIWHNVGEVRSVNPARRELRIRTERCRANVLQGAEWIWVQIGKREPVRYRAASIRRTADETIAALVSGVPRDEVRMLEGARIVTDELAAPVKDEFALSDLIGMTLTENGDAIGEIVDAMETPAHDVAEIERADGTRALVPLAAELVIGIDFEAGRIDMREVPLVESAAAKSG